MQLPGSIAPLEHAAATHLLTLHVSVPVQKALMVIEWFTKDELLSTRVSPGYDIETDSPALDAAVERVVPALFLILGLDMLIEFQTKVMRGEQDEAPRGIEQLLPSEGEVMRPAATLMVTGPDDTVPPVLEQDRVKVVSPVNALVVYVPPDTDIPLTLQEVAPLCV